MIRFLSLLLILLSGINRLNAQDLNESLARAFYSEDSSEFYYNRAFSLLESKEDSVMFHYYKLFTARQTGDLEAAKQHFNYVKPYYLENDSLRYLRVSYAQMYKAYLNAGLYDEAMKFVISAYNTAEKMQDTIQMASHLADISVLYHDMGNYKEGISYGKKAVETAKDGKSLYFEIAGNNAIAINFDDNNIADSAIHYHKRNLKLLGDFKDSSKVNFIFNNLGNTYLKKKEYDEATKYLKIDLRLSQNSNNPYYLATVLTNLGQIATIKGAYNEANNYLKEARKQAELSKSIEKARDIAYQESEYEIRTNNYPAAFEKRELYHTLKDSMQAIERQRIAEEIEEKFQTAKQEKEILTQRAIIAEAHERNSFLVLLVGGLLLSAIILVLLFNRQRLKSDALKREKEIQSLIAEQTLKESLLSERLKISRDLHDNIGAQLTLISNGLDKIAKVQPELSQENPRTFESAAFALRELRSTIWTLDAEEISILEICSRTADIIHFIRETTPQWEISFVNDYHAEDDCVLDPTKGVELFRIIQEAIHNALKHASKPELKILISSNKQGICFTFENPVGDGMSGKGNGSKTMANRASVIGAEFSKKASDSNYIVSIFLPFTIAPLA